MFLQILPSYILIKHLKIVFSHVTTYNFRSMSLSSVPVCYAQEWFHVGPFIFEFLSIQLEYERCIVKKCKKIFRLIHSGGIPLPSMPILSLLLLMMRQWYRSAFGFEWNTTSLLFCGIENCWILQKLCGIVWFSNDAVLQQNFRLWCCYCRCCGCCRQQKQIYTGNGKKSLVCWWWSILSALYDFWIFLHQK